MTTKVISLGLMLLVLTCARISASGEAEVGPSVSIDPMSTAGMVLRADPTGQQKYAVPATFAEAPMLAALVAAGELPPVEERLPIEPFVVGPGVLNSEQWVDWKVGRYGGTIRVPHLSYSRTPEMMLALRTSILQPLDGIKTDPLPAIVADYQMSDDDTEYVFTIREGLRWSDGMPLTTEDVRMTFELYEDERIYPGYYLPVAGPDGTPPELTIIDNYSFKLTFKEPYGSFTTNLSHLVDDTTLFRPAHFMKQFHPDYAPKEEIQEVLEQAGLTTWDQMLKTKDITGWERHMTHAIGVPSLAPWLRLGSDFDYVLERNPYYWKVDVAGNQLPYVDRIVGETAFDYETIRLKVVAGEYDVVTTYPELGRQQIYYENPNLDNILKSSYPFDRALGSSIEQVFYRILDDIQMDDTPPYDSPLLRHAAELEDNLAGVSNTLAEQIRLAVDNLRLLESYKERIPDTVITQTIEEAQSIGTIIAQGGSEELVIYIVEDIEGRARAVESGSSGSYQVKVRPKNGDREIHGKSVYRLSRRHYMNADCDEKDDFDEMSSPAIEPDVIWGTWYFWVVDPDTGQAISGDRKERITMNKTIDIPLTIGSNKC